MSYKRKNGDIISRKDFELITEKELKKEFEPSGEKPNKSYDGENFGEVKEASNPSVDDDQDDDKG